ncbi:MAG: MBL fold metallo-hydrolase [Syntrophomonadaceae bacterium]|nr:MBL fold metallo-hydrolase [Syntrophomonadaceae bacterium]
MNKIFPIYNGTYRISFNGLGRVPTVEAPNFVFLVQTADEEFILFDTGYDPATLPGVGSVGFQEKHQRIVPMLRSLGLDPNDIGLVVMSHLHWDHAAAMSCFPRARFHVQARELQGMLHLSPKTKRNYYYPEHFMSSLERMDLQDGAHNLRPGIDVYVTGDHTYGHQILRIQTDAGVFVLAADSMANHDQLWSSLSAANWEEYHQGVGRGFYWPEDTLLPALENCLRRQGFPTAINEFIPPMSHAEIKALGKLIMSHDPRLSRNNRHTLW